MQNRFPSPPENAFTQQILQSKFAMKFRKDLFPQWTTTAQVVIYQPYKQTKQLTKGQPYLV